MTGANPDQADIVVQAYTPRFEAAFARLIGVEGGSVDDPVDHGGATRYGISLRFLVSAGQIDLNHDGFADFDLDMDGDIDGADIAKLTIGDAKFLYNRCFWLPLGCEGWAAPIGEAIFDQGVNGGLVAARKLLQRAINLTLDGAPFSIDEPDHLSVDGVLGDRTRAAFNWIIARNALGTTSLIVNFRIAAAQRYRAIAAVDPSQRRFLDGWLNRAANLGKL